MNIVLFLLVGLAAGAVAEKVTGAPMGLLATLTVGVAGAFVGGFLFGLAGLAARGLFGSLLTATAGAVLLLLAVGLVHRKS
jgi:uncharacterized membrane protein YeaQ/YmgE (transglycosylase-associated protein family)